MYVKHTGLFIIISGYIAFNIYYQKQYKEDTLYNVYTHINNGRII